MRDIDYLKSIRRIFNQLINISETAQPEDPVPSLLGLILGSIVTIVLIIFVILFTVQIRTRLRNRCESRDSNTREQSNRQIELDTVTESPTFRECNLEDICDNKFYKSELNGTQKADPDYNTANSDKPYTSNFVHSNSSMNPNHWETLNEGSSSYYKETPRRPNLTLNPGFAES